MTEKLYAIIDGAAENELLTMLEELDPPVSCLYAEPVQEELIAIAPYLVEVNDEVKSWLTSRNSNWGFYCTSKASLKDVRHHFRKHLQAIIAGEQNPVFFRFYDPRNIWVLCDLLSDWQLNNFLGPISSITTTNNQTFTDDFKTRRQQFPRDAVFRKKMLTFDMRQINIFERHLEQTYIEKLTAVISCWHHKSNVNYDQFCQDAYYYFQSIDIIDDRTVRGLCKLFLTKGFFSIDDVPASFKKRLEHGKFTAQVNAELLMIELLGSVPLLDK